MKSILFIKSAGTPPASLTVLERDGFKVDTVYDTDSAMRRLEYQDCYDVVILQEAPSVESWQFCRDMRRVSSLPLIVISYNASTEVCVRAIKAGADFFLRKPFGYQELLARIRALLYRSNLQARRRPGQPVPASR
jgi:DNA-binding response OmpR family regulator